MQITYKTSVANANTFRIEVSDVNVKNGVEVFVSKNGEVEFTRNIVSPVLKVVYIISALDGTEVEITYDCKNDAGKEFEDPDKKSPHKKTVPTSNRTQVTLNIPLA